ncbi:MAG: hypothetical protein ACE5I5_15360 [Candidatus Heimdallarchaeota archaeon]
MPLIGRRAQEALIEVHDWTRGIETITENTIYRIIYQQLLIWALRELALRRLVRDKKWHYSVHLFEANIYTPI